MISRYVDPKCLRKRINREYLRTSRSYGAYIKVNLYGKRRVSEKTYIEASLVIRADESLIKSLKKLGLKFSKKEKRGLFEPPVLASLLRKFSKVEIPIGVSRDEERIIRVPWPARILTDSPLSALTVSVFAENAIWIDYLGVAEYVLEIFEEGEGVPLNIIPAGAREDLAKIIARKTIGERFSNEIAKILKGETEQLESDEEIAMIGPEHNALAEILEWKILSFEKELMKDYLYVDISGASTFSFIIACSAALLSNRNAVIVSAPYYKKELEPLLRREGVIYVLPTITEHLHLPFDVIISEKEGTVMFRAWLGGKGHYIDYIEEYISIDTLIKEVSEE
ncbi:MAG: hypothetical protein ACTSX9_04965 [Candidatus Njordarchaeales archaeon]